MHSLLAHQITIIQKTILFVILGIGALSLNAQIGGLFTYDFLNLSSSARATALGGYPISISDEDVAQGLANPALINEKMSHHLSINHNFHLADISHGFMAYGLSLKDQKTSFIIGASYINYGEFTRADIFGNRTGNFSGSENAFTLGASRSIDERLKVGANLKFVNSNFDTYQSIGLGLDLGLYYHNDIKDLSWSFVVKNIGGQLSSFDVQREPFPIDIQIGYAKRLEHLPFRFMITGHKLHRWNLRSPLDDQGTISLIGQEPQEPSSFSKTVDNVFRHLAFGGELMIGQKEAFKLRFGYNHLRNKELSVSGFRSLSGLSFGFGLRIKKIQLDYGVGWYHLAGGANHLSVSIDLESLFSKL